MMTQPPRRNDASHPRYVERRTVAFVFGLVLIAVVMSLLS